jgi:hypothetical protein
VVERCTVVVEQVAVGCRSIVAVEQVAIGCRSTMVVEQVVGTIAVFAI